MIQTRIKRDTYSEVFELLKHINRRELDKIPMEMLQTIKENKNDEYKPNINFENLNIVMSKEAKELYIWLYITYMAESQEEKDRVRKILYENDMKANSNLKLNDDVFKKKIENKSEIENNSLVEYKQHFIQKIINKIKMFFKRK